MTATSEECLVRALTRRVRVAAARVSGAAVVMASIFTMDAPRVSG